MNPKILASLAVLAIAAAGTSYGTFAFFSDTETSTNNIFTAGDLDLTLDGLNGVTATIVGVNYAPGDSSTGSILLRNEGSIFTGDAQGHVVDLDICAAVVDTDAGGNPDDPDDGGVSPITFARWLNVTSLTYGGDDLRAFVGDRDADGRPNTLHDVMKAGRFGDLADPGAAGRTLALAVHFAEDGPNYLKRDVSTLTFTFFLSQRGEIDLNCATLGGVAGAANAPVAYFNSFSAAPGGEWSVGTHGTAPSSEKFHGPFGVQSSTLSLAGLPAHSEVTIEADIYIISSWDGNAHTAPLGPDQFQIAVVGGPTLLDTTFSNVHGSGAGYNQCYPSACPASFPAGTGRIADGTLGYSGGATMWGDTIYRLRYTVPHTGSTLGVTFAGNAPQGWPDEGWGLDNVRVSVS